MIGLYIFCAVIGVITYLCLAVKIGFIVGDVARHTGFDFGFYMITVFGLIALPICIAIGILA